MALLLRRREERELPPAVADGEEGDDKEEGERWVIIFSFWGDGLAAERP